MQFGLIFEFIGLSDLWGTLIFKTGSNNPLGLDKNTDKIPSHPYYAVKDILGFAVIIIMLAVLTM